LLLTARLDAWCDCTFSQPRAHSYLEAVNKVVVVKFVKRYCANGCEMGLMLLGVLMT
jgi:hypothetical protein